MSRRAFYVVCLCQALGLLSVDLVVPFLPALLQDLGVRGDARLVLWTGWAQAATFVVSLAATPLWGRLGDATGRKRMLVRAYLGMALASVFVAWSTTPWEVVAGRALQGALAGMTPAALALVAEGSDAAWRMSWARSAALAGSLVGPILGGLLLPLTGAASLYLVAAGLTTLAAGLTAWLVQEPPRRLQVVESEGPRGDWIRTVVLGPGALAAWVVGWRSLEDPVITLFVQRLCGEGADWALWAGVAVGAARATSLVSGPLWGRRVDRDGAETTLRSCLLGAAVLTAAQGLAGSPLALTVIRAALGVFGGALLTALYAVAVERSPGESRGEAIAYASSGARLGKAAGTALAGFLAAAVGLPGLLATAGLALALPLLRRGAR